MINMITLSIIIIINISFAQDPRSFYWELGGYVYNNTTSNPVNAFVAVIAVSDHFDSTGRVLESPGDVIATMDSQDSNCSGGNYGINAKYTQPDEDDCTNQTLHIYYGDVKVQIHWDDQIYETSVDFDYSPGGDNDFPMYLYDSPDCFIDFNTATLTFTRERQGGYPSNSNNFVFTAPDDYDFQNFNYHWFGTINVVSDIVIPSNRTLTVEPGTTVKFANGKKLSIYGVLIAEGTETDPITFTREGTSGCWYGIRFENSSVDQDCIIKYANIEYASYGIYCYKAAPAIENNVITNNTHGIYIYNDSPDIKTNEIAQNTQNGIWMFGSGSTPYVYDNYIHDNNSDGIKCYYSTAPSLFNNTIKSNGSDGVYAYYYSSPEFGPTSGSAYGNNKVYNNNANGLYAYYYSLPFLGGGFGPNVGGYNSLYSNSSYNVKAINNSDVMAKWNWWGNSTPPAAKFYSDGSSSIDYSLNLFFPIAQGSSLGRITGFDSPSDLDLDTNSVESLEGWGMYYFTLEDYPNAINIYKILVRRFSSLPAAKIALIRINNCYHKLSSYEGIDYLGGIINELDDENLIRLALDLLVNEYQIIGEFESAIETANLVIQEYPDTESEYFALFILFSIYYSEFDDDIIAGEILYEMVEYFPDYDLTMMAQYEMGEDVTWTNAIRAIESEEEDTERNMIIANMYGLDVNYPNPFNPTTKIDYQLPMESSVTIRVYNILGKEIKTLVNNNEQAGFKNIIWNGIDSYGQNVPSGVYLYSITAKSLESDKVFTDKKKMILLK